ncbi:MAG: NAD-dependent epimerase/dehydratase family protein [Planctomycetota bacterium]|jgi:UDP-glucose 4-epimerase
MSKYLVTGGAGFIGSHLVDRLLAQGEEVRVLDDFSTGTHENLDQSRKGLEVVHACITSEPEVSAAMSAVDGVFHLAALPSVERSVVAPLDTHHINATGGLNILNQARKRGVKVVFAGSSSAYGDQAEEYKNEDLREDPLSPYAASKLAGEMYCRSFARVYDLPVVVTRFFNVYGPRQVPDSPYSGVIAAYCLAMLRDQSPRIDGDGRQSRDFTYVDDVTRAMSLAMNADFDGPVTMNIACGEGHDLLEMLAILKEYSGCSREPEYAPPRAGDVRHSQADMTLARKLLNFTAEVSFREGLEKTFDWYRRQYS